MNSELTNVNNMFVQKNSITLSGRLRANEGNQIGEKCKQAGKLTDCEPRSSATETIAPEHCGKKGSEKSGKHVGQRFLKIVPAEGKSRILESFRQRALTT